MILINGEQRENISVQDRGLHYGDGLFETIAITQGVPVLWERHMLRLKKGCQQLGFPSPDTELLLNEVLKVIQDKQRCVIKIIITRGESGRGYRAPVLEKPDKLTRIVATYQWPEIPSEYVSDGVRVRVCETRLAKNAQLAGIKHLNRLEQVLARNEWHDPDVAEGLMLDNDDYVIEATASNLFIIKDEQLYTPDVSECGVDGVMRNLIIDLVGTESIPVNILKLTLDDVKNADELFLCNSLVKLWPVRQLETTRYNNNPVTRKISKLVNNENKNSQPEQ